MIPAGVTDAELRALLWLRCIPGLGDRRLAALLGRCGSAEAVARLPVAQLSQRAEPVQVRSAAVRVDRALRLVEEQQLQLLALPWPGFPSELLELADPPILLFGRGDMRLLGRTSVAVVGTRRPTDYGVSVTEQLVSGLVRAGVVVWSGMARGIDSVAHRAALDGGGATVAVLGSGIDVPYPREHAGLLEEIARAGLVLSEFMPGEPPLTHHFPQRNRILACLAHGVLVVEARPDGGALITAEAGSGSRPIMAVPGPIGRLTSLGPNRLIQDGAKLVVEVADILEELGGQLNAAAARERPSARKHWRKSGPGSRPGPAPEQLALVAGPSKPAGQATPAPVGKPTPAAAGGAGSTESREAKRRTPRLAARAKRPAVDPVAALFPTMEPVHVDEIAGRAGRGAAEMLGLLLDLELQGFVQQVGGKRFRRTRPPLEDTPPSGEGGEHLPNDQAGN